jgi:hypothetical protein
MRGPADPPPSRPGRTCARGCRPPGHVPPGLRRPPVPPALRLLPAVHHRRRARPGRPHGPRLPAHRLGPPLGGHLRDQLPAVAAGGSGAGRPGRPAPPAPGAHRQRRGPRRAGRRHGGTRRAAAGAARPAAARLGLRPALRGGPRRPHGRRAGGRPVRRRHLADQHHPAAGPGRGVPGGGRDRRRPQPVRGPAHRRGHLRRLGAVAVGRAEAQTRPPPRRGRRTALAVAGHGRGPAADRPVATAARDHRGALGGDAVRLRLRGCGGAAGRGARPRVDGVDRHPARGQPARRDDRRAGDRPAGGPGSPRAARDPARRAVAGADPRRRRRRGRDGSRHAAPSWPCSSSPGSAPPG